MKRFYRSGSGRIVQIPVRGLVRYGTVLRVSADGPTAATLIEWDNGGEEWIRDEDFPRHYIWLVSDVKKEPHPTPLEDLLRAFLTPPVGRQHQGRKGPVLDEAADGDVSLTQRDHSTSCALFSAHGPITCLQSK